jgi:hypothetical protein
MEIAGYMENPYADGGKAGAVLMGDSALRMVRYEEGKPRLTPSPGLITRLQARIFPVEWVARPMEILILCGRY